MAKNINDEIIDLMLAGKNLSEVAKALNITNAKLRKVRDDKLFQDRMRERIPEYTQAQAIRELTEFKQQISAIAKIELELSEKLLTLINKAVDQLFDHENPLTAIETSRNLPNLIKASTDMADKAKASASEVLGINEILATLKRPEDQYDQLSLDFGFWKNE